jgi:hypothetical protein
MLSTQPLLQIEDDDQAAMQHWLKEFSHNTFMRELMRKHRSRYGHLVK